jgi:hypothetical protein
MEIENLFKIVKISYEMDKIKLETKLETIINSGKIKNDKKVKKIKKYIGKLALLELHKNKFNMMTNDDNNNK